MAFPYITSGRIDQLYLDNTYCSPACHFPSRKSATERIIDIIASHPSEDIILGLRNLGKENLLCNLAEHFQEYISVPSQMFETLQILKAPDVFVRDSSECRIRVVPFHRVSNKLVSMLNEITPTVVILPTALYCGIKALPYENQEKVFVVPYSDHSSYAELERFVSFIKPARIIPVVKANARGPFGLSVADRADMTIFQKYTRGGWNINFDIPRSVKRYMMNLGDRAMQNRAGKKRKARQTDKVLASKRAKRGVIYDSPTQSHSAEKLAYVRRKGDKGNWTKGSKNRDCATELLFISQKSSTIAPGLHQAQFEKNSRSKDASNTVIRSKKAGACLEKNQGGITDLSFTASSLAKIPHIKISAQEKVQNWLCTTDITNLPTSAENLNEGSKCSENEAKGGKENQKINNNNGVEYASSECFVIQESQGFQVNDEVVINESSCSDMDENKQDSDPQECVREWGSGEFNIAAENIFKILYVAEEERELNKKERKHSKIKHHNIKSKHSDSYTLVAKVVEENGKCSSIPDVKTGIGREKKSVIEEEIVDIVDGISDLHDEKSMSDNTSLILSEPCEHHTNKEETEVLEQSFKGTLTKDKGCSGVRDKERDLHCTEEFDEIINIKFYNVKRKKNWSKMGENLSRERSKNEEAENLDDDNNKQNKEKDKHNVKKDKHYVEKDEQKLKNGLSKSRKKPPNQLKKL